MRHSVHLMFGGEFTLSIQEFKKYIIKYGEATVSPYIKAFLWQDNSDHTVTISSVEPINEDKDAPFVSGLQTMYNVSLAEERNFPAEEQNTYISDFFDELFRQTITINNPGEVQALHLFLYLPLYDDKVWKTIQNIVALIKTLPIAYHIDIIGLAPDTAFLFTPSAQTNNLPLRRKEHSTTTVRIIAEVLNFKKENSSHVFHFLMLQNSQSKGLSLQLNLDAYTRIIGELACVWAQHYSTFFLLIRSSDDVIKAVGLSVLSFDKYFFVEYLLKRTYLYLLDKEKITDTKVHIAKVARTTQNKLKSRTHLLTDFWADEVKPLLDKSTQEDIIVELTPKVESLIKNVSDDLLEFLEDNNLSLPEKKAAMAVLLGFDDELLSGYLFNPLQLVLDDIEIEPAAIFIDVNNELFARGDVDKAVLSLETRQPAYLPIKEIKDIRESMRQSTSYIREKEQELEKIDIQIEEGFESEKRLIEDGYFTYGEQRFKLIAKDIEPTPFEKNYEPSEFTKHGNIDLRTNFTKIKNQGKLGACTAFALVGVYEYILKSGKKQECKLSESFLYYNTRNKNGQRNVDLGADVYQSYLSFKEFGVCREELHPYDEENYSLPPTAEAYEQALSYKIKEIQNVKGTLDYIRTALADGYPVIISLKIYNSFVKNKSGFIFKPLDEEIKSGEYGGHTMIICGYSDERKLFIVRNSWDTSFGENGYCYISYSYIEDSELLTSASIISQIESEQSVKGVEEKRTQVYFDITDANIRYAITRNLVEYEYYRLGEMKKLDDHFREQYFNLISKLNNNRIRQQLIESKETILSDLIENSQITLKESKNQKTKKLKSYACTTFKTMLLIWCATTITLTILGNIVYSRDPLAISIGVAIVLISQSLLYLPYRKIKKRALIRKLNDNMINIAVSIDNYKNERDTIRLKMHIAGMLLDRLFGINDLLINKYNVMKSFTGNLISWFYAEKEDLEKMDPTTRDPFISLLDNTILDVFFEEQKDNIIKDIKLSDFIKSYVIKESEIIKFKRNIKSKVAEVLFNYVDDFNMIDYILNDKTYPYLTHPHDDCQKLLPVLDQKSEVFIQLTTSVSSAHKMIFINSASDANQKKWLKIYDKNFALPPVSQEIISPFKLIVAQSIDLPLDSVTVARQLE